MLKMHETVTEPSVLVLFACNDPMNGRPTDRVRAVGVGDELLEVVGEAEFHALSGWVVVAGRRFPTCSEWTQWVGNWCWDGVRMRLDILAVLLEHLRRQEWFCGMALEEFYAAWNGDEPITAELLARLTEGAGR